MSDNSSNGKPLSDAEYAFIDSIILKGLVRGSTYAVIAQQCERSISFVHKRAHLILARIAQENKGAAERHIAVMLTQLDKVICEAWAGWERSMASRRKLKAEDTIGGRTLTREKQTTAGAPEYLDVIMRAISKKMELLGIGGTKGKTLADFAAKDGGASVPLLVPVKDRAEHLEFQAYKEKVEEQLAAMASRGVVPEPPTDLS